MRASNIGTADQFHRRRWIAAYAGGAQDRAGGVSSDDRWSRSLRLVVDFCNIVLAPSTASAQGFIVAGHPLIAVKPMASGDVRARPDSSTIHGRRRNVIATYARAKT